MLSNTATPKYYKEFRDKVLRDEIKVCETVSLEMNRIDKLIADPRYYYDPAPVEGWIAFCEAEMTLTDGSPVHVLDSFKLWAEQVYGWYEFVIRDIPVPNPDGKGVYYAQRRVKKRLTMIQYLIVARGAAKSMYGSFHQSYGLNVDSATTHQITTAPTMKQAEEIISPIRTSITRAPGPWFKLLTLGSVHNTRGSFGSQTHLASTKKGIENFLTASYLEIRPMTIEKLQGLRVKYSTVDEWLSCEIRENPIGAIEQGASKGGVEDYLIIATSSEGTVRNGVGDTIKMDLMKILKGEYDAPHISIWWYQLDDIKEVGDPNMWVKANPNIGKTVSYEVYQKDKIKAENSPADRNDILAKRFGIPCEGSTYFFTTDEIELHPYRDYWGMPCALGADLSQGGDFCAFTFVFPLSNGAFGIKTINYITEFTMSQLPEPMWNKYNEFIAEGSLIVMPGTILDMMDVYDDLDAHILERHYDVRSFGFDPYNAREFVERWVRENGEFGVEKVIQGAKTESVPLTELKKLATERMLLFDEALIKFTMGNCMVSQDTNGNKKLVKLKYEAKIDAVAAMMDAFVSYKLNKDAFE